MYYELHKAMYTNYNYAYFLYLMNYTLLHTQLQILQILLVQFLD